ncbi:Hypothetical protein GbCGDNIH2_0542 [Granulibacter bethesdensis]|uniref:Uncharacterized protein n=1 Tax=Granulibacter bethesdensis (strain ATCC BAA-1260 / CGDNIH1) TaxID=391165 RepID=Q0BUR2_GRABC|nr:Hypothetical protein GbCGDNIH1_0542 [Granulibacter bethesdensis CGDNIH1]APG30596.1 Hypothetical protein GbCGDNIH2_0542 [Granulibacter bethesdensis]APH51233.1 Hypothetical protein GbCGDNIH5_0542 [Granulibacter bethesdensis]APH63927.1 Hypothetical protein GbCGDNIH1I4_0542 [Granulibacter bethesdensis]
MKFIIYKKIIYFCYFNLFGLVVALGEPPIERGAGARVWRVMMLDRPDVIR